MGIGGLGEDRPPAWRPGGSHDAMVPQPGSPPTDPDRSIVPAPPNGMVTRRLLSWAFDRPTVPPPFLGAVAVRPKPPTSAPAVPCTCPQPAVHIGYQRSAVASDLRHRLSTGWRPVLPKLALGC